MVYSDGSEYRGGMKDGVKSGYGTFVWPTDRADGTSHIYIGQWKDGMMHGEGRFKHMQNFVIESIFCNNLAMLDDGHFLNPFMTE